MPPKGWRKDAQGNYPTTSYIKEQESITIEDLLFPKSVIVNLAKEIQAEDSERKLMINKDAALALQRSATVFVNHLLLFARQHAKQQDKKSCNVDDILNALDHIGHPGLKNIVRSKMDDYTNAMEIEKREKQEKKAIAEENDVHNTDSYLAGATNNETRPTKVSKINDIINANDDNNKNFSKPVAQISPESDNIHEKNDTDMLREESP